MTVFGENIRSSLPRGLDTSSAKNTSSNIQTLVEGYLDHKDSKKISEKDTITFTASRQRFDDTDVRVDGCRRTDTIIDDSKETCKLALELTKNGIPLMVERASMESSGDIDKLCNMKEKEGVFPETKSSFSPGKIIVRLYNLCSQQPQTAINHQEYQNDVDQLPIFQVNITDGSQWCPGAIWQRDDHEFAGVAECSVSVSGFVLGTSFAMGHDVTDTSQNEYINARDKCIHGNNGTTQHKGDSMNTSKQTSLCSPFIFITSYEILNKIELGGEKVCDEDPKNEQKLAFTEFAAENHHEIKLQPILLRSCISCRCGRVASFLTKKFDWNALSKSPEETVGRDSRLEGHHTKLETTNSISTALKFDPLEVDNFLEYLLKDDFLERLVEVSNFLEEHSGITQLKCSKDKASLLPSSSFSLITQCVKHFKCYESALCEFDKMQCDQQFTSISDMMEEAVLDGFDDYIGEWETRREQDSIPHVEQGWIQNTETLEYALQCKDEPLSPELLLRWHAWLFGDGLEEEAGTYRSEASSTQVEALCQALEEICIAKIRKEPTNPLQIALFGAAAVVGILDILPFKAGNRRVARILLNWCLRRAGLPFCVTFYSNSEEKLAYYFAIDSTKQNFDLMPFGCVEKVEMNQIINFRGGLSPLVSFILHRIALATKELSTLVQKKSRLASEEADARLVRLAREKAAKNTCIICFEENPNISTLCCGKEVHFNCLGEWLRSHSTCPQCRSDLPPLSPELPMQTNQRLRYRSSTTTLSDDEFLFAHSATSSSSEESSSSSSSSDSDSLESFSSQETEFLYRGLDLDYGVDDVASITNQARNGRPRSVHDLFPVTRIPSEHSGYSNFRYVTSDEEDEDHNYTSENIQDSSTDSYTSEIEEGLNERMPFSSDRIMRQSYLYLRETTSMADHDSLSGTDFQQQIDGASLDSPGNYNEISEIDSHSEQSEEPATSSFAESDDEGLFRNGTQTAYRGDPDYFHPFRVSFLDPDLMENVQNVQNEVDEITRSTGTQHTAVHRPRHADDEVHDFPRTPSLLVNDANLLSDYRAVNPTVTFATIRCEFESRQGDHTIIVSRLHESESTEE